MKCKFCGKELEDGAMLCASCGKENPAEDTAEQKATQKPESKPVMKPWKVVLCTLGGILLLAIVTFAVLYGAGVRFATAPATEATDPMPTEEPGGSVEATMETLATSVRDLYTVSDEEALAHASEVIATVGNKTLTNEQLQMFYWTNVFVFLDDYSSYLSALGLDLTKPFSEQYFDEATQTTWEQYFMDYTLHVWHRYAAVCLLGEEAGYVLKAETQEYMDTLEEELEEIAAEGGYESGLELLQAQAGAGITLQGYLDYMYICQYSMEYFDQVFEELDPTMEEMEAFYSENIDAFAQSNITKESGNLADVRHILITPKGGTTDENNETVYSEEEWATCLEEAQKILDMWKAGEATEESFAELANTYSEDPGSNTVGGLYEQVTEGRMVPEFNDWIFDTNRVYADTDLVKTSYGYHVMFFVKCEPMWLSVARVQVVSEQTSKMIDDATVRWPIEIEYDAIVLGNVVLSSAS